MCMFAFPCFRRLLVFDELWKSIIISPDDFLPNLSLSFFQSCPSLFEKSTLFCPRNLTPATWTHQIFFALNPSSFIKALDSEPLIPTTPISNAFLYPFWFAPSLRSLRGLPGLCLAAAPNSNAEGSGAKAKCWGNLHCCEGARERRSGKRHFRRGHGNWPTLTEPHDTPKTTWTSRPSILLKLKIWWCNQPNLAPCGPRPGYPEHTNVPSSAWTRNPSIHAWWTSSPCLQIPFANTGSKERIRSLAGTRGGARASRTAMS